MNFYALAHHYCPWKSHFNTYYYISPFDKPHSGLENYQVAEVADVTDDINDKPVYGVTGGLVGEHVAQGNEPAVPVVGDCHEHEPRHITAI